MDAISLSQPWAWSMVCVPPPERKDVENRSSQGVATVARHHIGKRVAVHAAKSYDDHGAKFLRDQGLIVPMKVALPAGAVIGVWTIADVLHVEEARRVLPPAQLRYAFGEWCILVRDTTAIAKPVPCRGHLGFWPLPHDVEREVLAQLGGQP
jgi:hypothetical protein